MDKSLSRHRTPKQDTLRPTTIDPALSSPRRRLFVSPTFLERDREQDERVIDVHSSTSEASSPLSLTVPRRPEVLDSIEEKVRSALLAQDLRALFECAQRLVSCAELDLETIRRAITSPPFNEKWSLCFGFESELREGEWERRATVERRTTLPVRPHRDSESEHSSGTHWSSASKWTPNHEKESAPPASSLALGRLEWFYALRRAPQCLTFCLSDDNEDDDREERPRNMCTRCEEIYRERSTLSDAQRVHPERGLSPSRLTAAELQVKLSAMRKLAQRLEKRVAHRTNAVVTKSEEEDELSTPSEATRKKAKS